MQSDIEEQEQDKDLNTIAVTRKYSSHVRPFTERKHSLDGLVRRISRDIPLDHHHNKALQQLRDEVDCVFHVLDVSEVLEMLGTTTRGLDEVTAASLLKINGRNILSQPFVRPLWLKFLLSFFVGFAPLLWFAAFIVFLAWRPFGTPPFDVYNLALAIVLLIVIFVSSIFNFVQEVLSTSVVQGFSHLIPHHCIVVRGGEKKVIHAECLVVGDICHLQLGQKVPSDMRVVSLSGLKLDRSMLTGENKPAVMFSEPVPSTTTLLQANNILMMGCACVEGEGVGVVIATGKNNQLSKIAKLVNRTSTVTTGLQRELNRFVAIIASMALTLVVTCVLYWSLYLRVAHPSFMSVGSMLANTISVVVAFVPEGLPLALSMGLTSIARRLCLRYGVMVYRLSIIETLGSMSYLCTDKTGTLTTNQMTVVQIITATASYPPSSHASAPASASASVVAGEAAEEGSGQDAGPPRELLEAMRRVALFCNQATVRAPKANAPRLARLEEKKDDDEEDEEDEDEEEDASSSKVVGGNAIDRALLEWLLTTQPQEQNQDQDQEDGAAAAGAAEALGHLRESVVPLCTVPFCSATKTAACVISHYPSPSTSTSTSPSHSTSTSTSTSHSLSLDGSGQRARERVVEVLLKGAPEYVLDLCSSYLDDLDPPPRALSARRRCQSRPLTAEVRTRIQLLITAAADTGVRVLALARLVLDPVAFPEGTAYTAGPPSSFPLSGLEFLGCVGVEDPPREGVKEAVLALKAAGVRIVVVTGDAVNTATAIAKKVGIVELEQFCLHDMQIRAAAARLQPSRSLVVICPGDAPSSPASSSSSLSSSVSLSSSASVSTLASTSTSASTSASTSGTSSAPASASASATATAPPELILDAALLVEGRDLDHATPDTWARILRYKELVFARLTPDQKLAVILHLQDKGERIGLTGDGVNDSPALKRADVGIAMGSGSDVAREAADIVLLKDEFTSIVKGVEEGRLLFDNLRKVIAYQIAAGCWVELLPVLATFFLGMPQPLSAFLMIVISCITDVAAGVALTFEAPEGSAMHRPPRDLKSCRLVDLHILLYGYLFIGNLQAAACFILWFLFMASRGPTRLLEGAVPSSYDPSDGQQPALTFPLGYRKDQLVFAWNWGVAPNGLGADNLAAGVEASSVYFVCAVVCQWGHLLSVRIKTPYLFAAITDQAGEGGSVCTRICSELQGCRPKLSVVAAILFSALFALIFTEVPALQSTCGTASVAGKWWGLALCFSFIIFIIAEARKWLIALYPRSWIAKVAW